MYRLIAVGYLLILWLSAPVLSQSLCPCENQEPYNFTVNQTSQLDRSWNLWEINNAVTNSQFNQQSINQVFGHTFQNVPFLCRPTLTVVARPLGGQSDNDTISLQAVGGKYVWTSDLDQLPGIPANSNWTTQDLGPGWLTLTLPLHSLPGNGDLSSELVRTRLDVFIQDDTAVRSLTLSGMRCPGPGTSRECPCCGDGSIAWTKSSHTYLLNADGNVKRAYWAGGPRAQWIQTAGSSPIVPGSFEALNDTTVLLINEAGQIVKVWPQGSAVIPNTENIHPCSLKVTERGIFGIRKDNGHVVLVDENHGEEQSVRPWGDDPHVIVESSLIEGGDGRVLGVLRTGWPWNVYFDGNGKMHYATISEAGTTQCPEPSRRP